MYTTIKQVLDAYGTEYANFQRWIYAKRLGYNNENPYSVSITDFTISDSKEVGKYLAKIEGMQLVLGMTRAEIAITEKVAQDDFVDTINAELRPYEGEARAFLANFYVEKGNPRGWLKRIEVLGDELGEKRHMLAKSPEHQVRQMELILLDEKGIQPMPVS